jgi:hypothetical protein
MGGFVLRWLCITIDIKLSCCVKSTILLMSWPSSANLLNHPVEFSR